MYCDWPLLGRCCFCLPLRQGVLTFGYINIFFCAFMIGVYSYSVHYGLFVRPVYHGATANLPGEFGVALYCIELIFAVILIYGAHKKSIPYLKAYYYFAITTAVSALFIQILNMTSYIHFGIIIEMGLFTFAGMCTQLYLIILIRSLLKKLDTDGPHLFDNPLQQIVSGDIKIEPNGIYNNTTVEPIDS